MRLLSALRIGAVLVALIAATTAPSTSSSQSRDSAGKRVETVEVSGLGQSVREAREDAIRQAIQRIVGVYVDHRRRIELKMTDRQLAEKLDERILSYSNAYVETVEELEHREKGKLIEIKMRVSVVVQKLLDQLANSDIPVVGFDSRSADATLSTRKDERESALELLQSLLQDKRRLWRLEVANPKMEPEKPANPDHVWLRLDATLTVDDGQVRRWWDTFRQLSKYELQGRASVHYHRIFHAGRWEYCFQSPLVQGLKAEPGRPAIEGRALIGLCQVSIDNPQLGGGVSECIAREFADRQQAQELMKDFGVRRIRVALLDAAGHALRDFRIDPAQSGVAVVFPAIPAASAEIDPNYYAEMSSRALRERSTVLAFCHKGPQVLGISRLANQDMIVLPMRGFAARGAIYLQVGEHIVPEIKSIRVSVE